MRGHVAASLMIGVLIFVQVAACVDDLTRSERAASSAEAQAATAAARTAYNQVSSIAQAARYFDATSILYMSDRAKARARIGTASTGDYALDSVDGAAAFNAARDAFSHLADVEIDTLLDPTRTHRAALAAHTAAAVARALDRLAVVEANIYAAADADAETYGTVANRKRRAELRVRMEEFYVAFDEAAEEATEFFASASSAE